MGLLSKEAFTSEKLAQIHFSYFLLEVTIFIDYRMSKTQTCKQEYALVGKVLVDKSFYLIHEPFHTICVVLRRNRPRSQGASSGTAVCIYVLYTGLYSCLMSSLNADPFS